METTQGKFSGRWREVAGVFLKLGAVSYGGPAIMGIMQTEVQEKRAWLSKENFVEGLALVVVGIFAVAVYRLGRSAVGEPKQAGVAIGAALLAAFSPLGIVPTLLLAGSLGVAFYAHRRAGVVAAIAVLALLVWRLSPLPPMLAGAAAGFIGRLVRWN